MSSNMMLEKIVSLCKRRGFVYPGSEIYGGLANSWDYGPLGVELKNNIKQAWWKRFVQTREDMVGLDAAIILNPKVWLSSGHVDHFIDPLVECKNCHTRFRQDLVEGNICPVCGEVSAFTEAKMFNLMFKTFIGPSEESANVAYLRPETAQAIFVDFKQVVDSTRVKIPFGIAQIGKAFRNEITPGNFIFRTREFEQMEIEYFIKPPENEKQWQEYFEHWRQQVLEWLTVDLGLEIDKIHQFDVPEGERAHYSQKTIDFEYDFPFGRKELYGLAYRTDFDLKNHAQHSGQNLNFRDPETGEEYLPHVIEPSFGLDRSILAVLLNGYQEVAGKRLVLKINPKLAPYKAAVFPLLANKPRLHGLAKKIYLDLKLKFMVAWDERGNIGKRYASQDEIGTPFCITVDFQSLEDNTVTVRLRDSAKQDRVAIDSLTNFLHENI